MIFLEVKETGNDRVPTGFNCGQSSLRRANMIATELHEGLKGGMTVSGPVKTEGCDYVVTVECQPGTLASVQSLVEMSVAIWHRRGQLR